MATLSAGMWEWDFAVLTGQLTPLTAVTQNRESPDVLPHALFMLGLKTPCCNMGQEVQKHRVTLLALWVAKGDGDFFPNPHLPSGAWLLIARVLPPAQW